MFDTMKTAKRIREARMEKKMTQMQLADAMGVSYQAVSNWERGNSMPDISKIGDLCDVLGLSTQELLGAGSGAVVKAVRREEPLTEQELAQVAPMLPPEEVKEQTRKTVESQGKKMELSALSEIAPFLSDEYLEELVDSVEVSSLEELTPLAPFLSDEALDRLVRRMPVESLEGIEELAPFLEDDTLTWLVRQGGDKVNEELLAALAPFLSDEALDAVVDACIARGSVKELREVYCFLGDASLKKVAKFLMETGNLDGLRDAAPYL